MREHRPAGPAGLRSVLAHSTTLLRRRFPAIVAYTILFKLLTALVLGPLSAAVVVGLIRTSGRYSLANEDIAAFLCSVPGLLAVTAAIVLTLGELYLEQAGLLWLAGTTERRERWSAFAAIGHSIARAPDLLRLALRQAAILLACAAPFLAAGGLIYALLWARYDLNYLWTVRPPVFWTGAGLAGALLAGLAGVWIWLLLRWLLAVPLCVLRPASARTALRASVELTHGRRARSGMVLLALVVLLALASALGAAVLDAASEGLLAWLGRSLAAAVLLAGLLLIAHLLALALLALAGTVLYTFAVFELYLVACGESGVDPGAAVGGAAARLRHPTVIPRRTMLGAGAVLLVASSVASVGVVASLDVEDEVAITAHRGDSSRAPENTVPAIRAAIAAAADFAEIDVQVTGDGEVVVFHDQDLRRLAGSDLRVEAATLAELRTFDVGGPFAPEFAGTRIPTLAEALEAAGDDIRLNIELKTAGPPARLVENTLAVIQAHGAAGRCVLTSLSYAALAEVRRRTRDIPIGYIVAEAVGRPTRLDVDFLSVRRALATTELIREAHRAGMPVHVWTVNTTEVFDRVLDLGVDNVITDRPGELRARLREIQVLSPAERVLLLFRNRLAERG